MPPLVRAARRRFRWPILETLEARTVLTHCGPFDLGDGLGPKFIGDGVTTFSEDFSANPNHEDPATVGGAIDACEAQGERLFTYFPSPVTPVPVSILDLPPAPTHFFVLVIGRGATREIQFRGIHPDYEVAAVSIDWVTDGVSQIEFVGQGGSIVVPPEDDFRFWETAVTTRGAIIPGTQQELGSIQSVRVTSFTAFQTAIDNITVLVAPKEVNDPPIAWMDEVFVVPSRPGAPSSLPIDVLANDDDPEGRPLSLVSITAPQHGTAVIDGNSVIYEPAVNFHGFDEFDYTVRDEQGLTAIGRVRIGVNTRPTASNVSFVIPHGTTGTVALAGLLDDAFDADGDELFAALVSQPQHGTVSVQPGGGFTYSPTTAGGLVLPDSFAFHVFDGFQTSHTALAGIDVPNQPPTARSQEHIFDHGTPGPVFGRLPAFDEDGDVLSYELAGLPGNGMVEFYGDGWYAYTQHREHVDWFTGEFRVDRRILGPDAFTYRATDPFGGTAEGRIDLAVLNAPPFADYLTINPDEEILDYVDHPADAYVIPKSDHETSGDVFLPTQLSWEGAEPPLVSDASGRLKIELTEDRLQYELGLADIGPMVGIELFLDSAAGGERVATLFAAPPGGSFTGNLLSGSIVQSELRGPFAAGAQGFDGFVEALRAGRIVINVATIARPGGEIAGRIEKAGQPTKIAAPGPLSNDADDERDLLLDGRVMDDPLHMIVVHEPTHGALRYLPDGTFWYYPPVGFEGEDGFTYVASDGFRTSDPASVRIRVEDRPPTIRLNDDIISMSIVEFEPGFNLDIEQSVLDNDDLSDFVFDPDSPGEINRSYTFLQVGSYSENLGRSDFGGIFENDGTLQVPCFIGTRHFAYALAQNDPIRGSHAKQYLANVASVTLHVFDADRDGDGLTDFEEGVCSGASAALDPAVRDSDRLTDSDGDGILNFVEIDAPGNGDANGDGILDLRQNGVASVDTDAGHVTLVAPDGTRVAEFNHWSRSNSPPGYDFPLDNYTLELEGAFPGIPLTVELLLPGEFPLDTYLKYGVEPEDDLSTPIDEREEDHWYEFLYDGTTGAELIDADGDGRIERIVLHLLDGERGDSDLAFNGRIVDPGGPAVFDSPPQVASVAINDGEPQRSMITSLSIIFSEVVALETGAIELRRVGARRPVKLNIDVSEIDGRTVARLTFKGAGIIGGSLADGTYRLTIRGDKVHGDGTSGGDYTDQFFRRFGDTDGDGDTDLADGEVLRSAFGKRRGSEGYLWYLDFNNNGRIWAEDLAMFLRRYWRSARGR